jgi:small subunit ribosomal protein S1
MSRPTGSTNEAAWAEFFARHGVGDVVEGSVVSVEPFGAFVRVGDDVDGLAPRPEWSVLPDVGAAVQVRILAVDPVNRRAAFGPVS